MKLRYIIVALVGALTLGFASCEKAHEYDPAVPETGNQVYFATGLPTSYNLKGLKSLTIPVMRADASANVSIPFDGLVWYGKDTAIIPNPSPFIIPQIVTFAAGSKTAKVEIGIVDSLVLDATDYNFILAFDPEHKTEYGKYVYQFTASIPSSWTLFGKGHVTEVCWEEDYDTELYYQETPYEDYLKCKLVGAWKTYSGDVVVLEKDYEFYWNIKTNKLIVGPNQHGYVTSSGSSLYVSDAFSFYNGYYGYGYVYPSIEFFEKDLAFNAKNNFFQPYYDGNGGFYLGDWYYGVSGGVPTGSGWQFGDAADYFIADGFVRTVDYNDDNHIGSSVAAFTSDAYSMFFSYDAETPYDFECDVRMDDYAEGDETTVYYLKDYFMPGYCLAFTAPVPELLEEGAEISDVENDQFTGIYTYGAPIFVSVKKGTVSMNIIGQDTFPQFNIDLKVYSRDSIYNVTYDFGTMTEVVEANGFLKDNYTIEDVYGGNYEDYLGTWSMTATAFGYDIQYTYDMQIESAGENLFRLINLSGFGQYFGDTVIANYMPKAGVMTVTAQKLNSTYEGDTVMMYILDPDAGKIYGKYDVLGGICTDGALAFVNRYTGVNFCGFYYITAKVKVCGMYYAFGFSQADNVASKYVMKARKDYVTAPVTGGMAASTTMKFHKVSDKVSTPKTFNLSPIAKKADKPAVKSFVPAN